MMCCQTTPTFTGGKPDGSSNRKKKGEAIMNAEGVREVAYKLYQLDWMQREGYGIENIIKEIENQSLVNKAFDFSDDASIFGIFKQWESDNGFGGELYACYKEFLNTEYLEYDYMIDLLMKRPDGKELVGIYLRDMIETGILK